MINRDNWIGKNYSRLTAYNDIYEQVYWGRFIYNQASYNFQNEAFYDVIRNRNNFINDYNIKGKCHSDRVGTYVHFLRRKGWHNGYRLDHIESYDMIDGRILIVNSPYGESQEQDVMAINDGWTKIYRLYSPGGTTYIKTFEKSQFGNKYFTDATGRHDMTYQNSIPIDI
jgi:hypothetical protein